MGRIKKGAALALCLFLLVGAAAGAVAADGEKEAANIIESDCFAPIGPGLESGEEGLDNLTSLEIGEITGQLTAQLGINFFILAYEKSPLDGQTLEDYITGYENAQKSRGEEFKNTILLFACVDEDLSVGQRFFLRLYGEAQGMLDGEEAE